MDNSYPASPISTSTMTPGRYLVLLIVAVTAPLGDTLLSRGMKQFGPVSLDHPGQLLQALLVPYVALGIVLLIGFFATYTAALSWADLTYVLPTTSIGNVFIALLARFWLHEPISLSRWLGIALITLGVGFVANGKSYTDTEQLGSASSFLPATPQISSESRGTAGRQ
jgi:drug/metabolite transporter (DMT)-like permease